MDLQYHATKNVATENLAEKLAPLVDDLAWRVRHLQTQLAMLDHPEPPPEPVPLDPAAMETAVRLDAIFMDHHPHVRMYVRYELPGECPREGLPPGKCVVVFDEQRSPAIRIRPFQTRLVYHAQQIVGMAI